MDEQHSFQLSPAPDNNHHKRVLLYAIGIILFLLIGGGIGYVLGINNIANVKTLNSQNQATTNASNVAIIPHNDNQTTINSTVKPLVTPPTQSFVDTTNWKSYSSNILSFKYPATLTLEERQKNYMVLLSNANSPQSVVVSIDARQSGDYATYENAVSATKAGLTNIQSTDMTNGIKISGKVGPGSGEGQAITIAIFKYGTAAVEAETTITNQSQLQTFNKILSTFTFTKH